MVRRGSVAPAESVRGKIWSAWLAAGVLNGKKQ